MSDDQSFQIEFAGEKRIPIKNGQTILDAALAAGIPHFHACGGNAECSTCRVLVTKGKEHLSEVNDAEKELRASINLPPDIRLACQTCVKGEPVEVRRIILEETDLSVYIKKEINNESGQVGEKKELVLFFLDIRNFTPFVESYLPFDVIHVIRAIHVIFNAKIKKYGGLIIDTAGDGFYAVFGIESNLKEACGQAILAGESIQSELKRFNETYLQPFFGTQFEVGIGVHCGEVIAGEVLVGQKHHLSVMGRAVNIASRIQDATKRLGNSFIVSSDVLRNCGRQKKGRGRTIKLKGIQGVFKVHMIGEALHTTNHS